MSIPMTAIEVLDREYPEIRAKILQLAASFDRMGRAEGSLDEDPRLRQLREAVEVLRDEREGRAERVQMLFSDTYDGDWRDTFGIATSR
jgi:hypothetical protein